MHRGAQHYRHRSIRLRGYDYTQPGAYFVTICTHGRTPLFGRVGGWRNGVERIRRNRAHVLVGNPAAFPPMWNWTPWW